MPYKDPEKRREYLKKYYMENKEKAAAYAAQRYKNKGGEIREKHKLYYMENKESIKLKKRLWYENNKATATKRQKEYILYRTENNPQEWSEILKSTRQKSYLKHKEKRLRKCAEYIKNNPEKIKRLRVTHCKRVKIDIDLLKDRYIKSLIMARWPFNSRDEIPQGLIDFKRAELKLKRTIKEIESNEKA